MQEKEFYYFGQYVAMSIAQGGSGFPFIAESLYHYMATGKCDGSLFNTAHLPDSTLQFVIDKVALNEVDSHNRLLLYIYRSEQQKLMMS